jgi:ABC-2 type transport system permease protein
MNIQKTYVIAVREYLAAVASKSFLISVVLLPVFMFGGILAQKLGNKIGDSSTYRVAVIDNSPGQKLYPVLEQAVKQHNDHEILDESGRQIHARCELEPVQTGDASDTAAMDAKRLALSDRVRSGELLAYVEIAPDVFKPQHPGDAPESQSVRYCSNRPTYSDFFELLQTKLPPAVIRQRMMAAAINFQQIAPLLSPPAVTQSGLAELIDGKLTYPSHSGRFASSIVPVVMIMMMFLVTLIGTSPIAANVVEEKQLRIAEVLLGGVTPFELLMGKLLGGVGVSLTLASLFFGGAYYVASTYSVARYVPGPSIAWFFFFTVVGTFMYGAMFAAAGAACSNIKEVQSFIMPVMLLIVLPMFLLGPLLENPSGPLGVALSFFPLSAPMVMVMRVTLPPGIAVWEPIIGAISALVATVVLIWAAGRIFRVGILMQGKGANYAAVLQWIVRG